MRLADATYEKQTLPSLRIGLRGRSGRDLLDELDALGTHAKYRRGQEIAGADQSIHYWSRLLAGTARQCAYCRDGRRQILAFLLPGDFFGFAVGLRYRYAVESVSDGTVVARFAVRDIETLFAASPIEEFSRIALESLSRMQARLLSLGRMTAREKVCSFLLEMNRRSPGRSADSVALPMSRRDIADYLALSVETVSR